MDTVTNTVNLIVILYLATINLVAGLSITGYQQNTETSAMLIKDACGGGELTSFAGEIMSPNYPDGYPNTHGGCYWTINRGNTDSVIRVTIRDLDLSGPNLQYGLLKIRDGPDASSPQLGNYYYGSPDYGSGATPITLVTSGPTAYISFWSSHDVTGHRGFDLAYTTEPTEPSTSMTTTDTASTPHTDKPTRGLSCLNCVDCPRVDNSTAVIEDEDFLSCVTTIYSTNSFLVVRAGSKEIRPDGECLQTHIDELSCWCSSDLCNNKSHDKLDRK